MSNSIPKTSGIYMITCTANGRIYIGSSRNLHKRIEAHKWRLKSHTHKNRHLQRAYDKYGETAFEYQVIEFVMPWMIIEREQYWIDKYKPFGDQGFNIMPRADGSHHSPESIKLQSESMKGRKLSPEHKAKLHAKLIGNQYTKGKKLPPFTDDHKNAIRCALIGKIKTDETCQKISDSKAYLWVVTKPDGEELSVFNLREFCRNNGLHQGHMVAVANGKERSHKGWKCRHA